MLPLAAKVLLGCVGAACVVKRKKRRGSSIQARSVLTSEPPATTYEPPATSGPSYTPPQDPALCYGQKCPAMPWLDDEVNAYMVSAWTAGERDATALGVGALRTVYPVGPDGQALRWPTARDDCDEKLMLESRVMLRAERIVGEARDLEADSMWFANGGY